MALPFLRRGLDGGFGGLVGETFSIAAVVDSIGK